MAAHLHTRHTPSPGMHLTKQQGFHLVTHQLEIDCYDKRHARDLNVMQSTGSKAEFHSPLAQLDRSAPDAKLNNNSRGNDT